MDKPPYNSKRDQEWRINLLIKALEIGHSRTSAAAHAGIVISTFYEWLKDEEFRMRVEKAESILPNKALKTINRNANDLATAKWILERLDSKYGYKTKQEVTVEGEISFTINLGDISEVSEDED